MYSQCEEDKYLNETFFKNKKNGVYLELGALDGVLYSNTKFFEDTLNWTGILIEPHPYQFESLARNRPNNHLFNDLVSCHSEPLGFRYFINQASHAAISGIENTLPQYHFQNWFECDANKGLPQTTTFMKPKTLTEIVKSTNITHIDFLSLDVEGHEYEVLQSWDFSIPIDLILIESLGLSKDKEELCRQIIENNGYRFMQKYKYNEIYILETSSLNQSEC